MKPAAPGIWKCDCGAANVECYQNYLRCLLHQPKWKLITLIRPRGTVRR